MKTRVTPTACDRVPKAQEFSAEMEIPRKTDFLPKTSCGFAVPIDKLSPSGNRTQ
jgi:hypothetical protein